MKPKGLDVLFHDTLKDIYYAERKLLKALPKMARAAQSDDLKAAFTAHKAETEEQKSRLDRVFEILGKRAAGKTCPAIDGILDEGDEILEEYKDSPTLDAGLIAAAQAVENYEIARYTALHAWAKALGHEEAATLLAETLAEETAARGKLEKMMPSHLPDMAIAAQ
jgi:ferritin-like metal-binding protein YciE